MQKPGSLDGGSERLWTAVALCALAASTMLVEIVLTKFIAFKVFHHYVFVIISTVILSFGAAGTCLYLFPNLFLKRGNGVWATSSKCALIYTLTLPIVLVLFCWMPLDPYNLSIPEFLQVGSIGIYFVLFSIPFFFGGVCISQILARSSLPVTSVYFLDLAAAAVGAVIAPILLETCDGYAAIAFASFLGLVAALSLGRASGAQFFSMQNAAASSATLVILAAFLVYPAIAWRHYGFDIRTTKNVHLYNCVNSDFHGKRVTYWNSVARIDISRTGTSNNRAILWGWPANMQHEKVAGRLVLVDGSAHTRQFRSDGELHDKQLFKDIVFASPYIANPAARRALVIGGGGGVDILVAKCHNVAEVDVAELNPSTYKHVLLGHDDPEAQQYQPWLRTDGNTKVNIFNSEARHFCSTKPSGYYDVIQASGVDTLTAITSGALASTDNYLYTIDAVRDYMRLLKPGGVLSLTHWRLLPPQFGLRMFVTYLNYLEQSGVKEPWRNVIVVGSEQDFVDSLMKATPFTQDESKRVRAWAAATGNVVLFDPFSRDLHESGVDKTESIYQTVGFATDPKVRQELLSKYPYDVSATTDDSPYFYDIWNHNSPFTSEQLESAPTVAICGSLLLVLLLVLVPLVKVSKKERPTKLLSSAMFFACCGFAFLLFELSMIQQFSILVGGPVYSLAAVLVSVLLGYSIGSLTAGKLPLKPLTFGIIGICVGCALLLSYIFLPKLISVLMPLSHAGRIAGCVAVTFGNSILCGMPVALAMEVVRRKHGDAVGWMWGVSSGFNALAAISFVAITQQTCISVTLAIAAALYFCGCLYFALKGPWKAHEAII